MFFFLLWCVSQFWTISFISKRKKHLQGSVGFITLQAEDYSKTHICASCFTFCNQANASKTQNIYKTSLDLSLPTVI